MLWDLLQAATDTLKDMLPIAVVVVVFQGLVLRRRPPNLTQIVIGVAHVFVGLTLFRLGLTQSLLPVGGYLADELARPAHVESLLAEWYDYGWLYVFAVAMGFGATLVEPTLAAVAERVRDMTGGTLRPWRLRVVVAVGIAGGLLVGTLRIVLGIPLPYALLGMVVLAALLVLSAPKAIVSLAFDTGPMATSVVTVPLISAFAIGVAAAVPDRDPLTDGFGLILMSLLGSVISVLTIASSRRLRRPAEG